MCSEAKIYIGFKTKPRTTKYGLESIKYLAAKSWNLLLDEFRTIIGSLLLNLQRQNTKRASGDG